jgi:hypothetical protein
VKLTILLPSSAEVKDIGDLRPLPNASSRRDA